MYIKIVFPDLAISLPIRLSFKSNDTCRHEQEHEGQAVKYIGAMGSLENITPVLPGRPKI